VTPKDVQRVAEQYIRPDHLSIVLVGNAKAFVPQLRQIGLAEVEVIPLAELDLTSATLRRDRLRVERTVESPRLMLAGLRGARPAPAMRTALAQAPAPRPQSPSEGARGRDGRATQPAAADGAAAELLRRVVEARGGLAALKAVRTVVADTATTIIGEQGDAADTTTTRTYIVYPDRFRVDATIQGQVVSQIYNAGRAWEKSPVGVRDMPPQVRDEAAASVKRDMIPLLIAAAEGRLTARVVANLPKERVLEIAGRDLDPVRLHIDDRMLIVRQVFSALGPDNRPLQAEESFSDYREVNGVRVPFQAQVARNGVVIVKRTITKVAFNEPVDPALFERPK
jgi:hypothetical protein